MENEEDPVKRQQRCWAYSLFPILGLSQPHRHGKKEANSKKMETMEKTEIIKVLQQLGVGFGNLIATRENISLGYQPKMSDQAESLECGMFGSGYNKQKLSLFYINVIKYSYREDKLREQKEQHMDNWSQRQWIVEWQYCYRRHIRHSGCVYSYNSYGVTHKYRNEDPISPPYTKCVQIWLFNHCWHVDLSETLDAPTPRTSPRSPAGNTLQVSLRYFKGLCFNINLVEVILKEVCVSVLVYLNKFSKDEFCLQLSEGSYSKIQKKACPATMLKRQTTNDTITEVPPASIQYVASAVSRSKVA
ncbi:inter-alpha-trypsin inhibitor heavy chain-related protein [Artemisia annua]|uniref:Inter-alpha-trypsin inhibitor heavy chain-related protein n=1 Tax=Artemisia annua TaxID=35608 RepID=A0A2U1NIR8_ARTAN|nr:inter-alpha-trypsin inhibitor heavy chain-related protein [Artemisia annua]